MIIGIRNTGSLLSIAPQDITGSTVAHTTTKPLFKLTKQQQYACALSLYYNTVQICFKSDQRTMPVPVKHIYKHVHGHAHRIPVREPARTCTQDHIPNQQRASRFAPQLFERGHLQQPAHHMHITCLSQPAYTSLQCYQRQSCCQRWYVDIERPLRCSEQQNHTHRLWDNPLISHSLNHMRT